MQKETSREGESITIGVVNNDETSASLDLIKGLQKAKYVVSLIEAEDDTQALRIASEQKFDMCLIIPEDYGLNLKNKKAVEIRIYSFITSLSIASSIRRASIRNILKSMNQKAAETFIKELSPDLKPDVLWEPIRAREFVVIKNVIQPGSFASIIAYLSIQTVIVPVALLMLIIVTGTMIASSIAQEKENKTLETILTVPVSRFTIILAKMLAAVLLAVGFAFFFNLAIGSYMSPFSSASQNISGDIQTTLPKISLRLDTEGQILLGISIFLSIVTALALATLLALFAQDVKDAQTTIMPLMIMILIPYFFSLVFDPGMMSTGLKIFTFVIPFSHTFFAFKFLILGQKFSVILGNIYLLFFAVALLFIATRVFSSEKILTIKFTFQKFGRKL